MCRVPCAGCLRTATPGFGGWLAVSHTPALTPTFSQGACAQLKEPRGSLCSLCQSREGKGTWEPRKFSEQEWPCPVFLSLLLQVPLPCQTQKCQCPQHHPGPLSPYAPFVVPRHSPYPSPKSPSSVWPYPLGCAGGISRGCLPSRFLGNVTVAIQSSLQDP